MLNIGSALGLYLWAWTIFTAYMFLASLRTTGAIALVFLLLLITFIILAIGNSGGIVRHDPARRLPRAHHRAAAWYASAAGVVNSTWGKTVLPVFPLSR